DFAARARARHPGVRCGFFPGDAPEGPFALVTLFDVLEHIERPLDFLAAIRDTLRPGGILALQVPNFDSPLVQVEGAGSTVVTPGHWSYFDPASLTRLLQRAGFQTMALQSYISELDRLLAYPPEAVRAALGPWAPEDLSTLRPADLFWRQLGFKLFGLFRRPE
ncbi:class I SAM-dependent methyltransferase, partial [Teichococcus deserti]|uniref:class I SAM-dependent methyltransferase n=1 Tax=Teichococcus deserti TaxID=1817963 RepID=UPI0010550EE1